MQVKPILTLKQPWIGYNTVFDINTVIYLFWPCWVGKCDVLEFYIAS